jgi:hypothetical protein
MPDFRRDTVFGKDGRFHDVRLVAGQNVLTYDGGAIDRPATRPLIGCRLAVDGAGVAWAIAPSWGDQLLVNLFTGEETIFPVGGNYGLASLRQMDHECEVYVRGPHDGAGNCAISVFDVRGAKLREFSAPYDSNGILQVHDDGSVTMVNHPVIVVIGGIEYRYCFDSNGWRGGQLNVALPAGGQGIVKPDGSQWVTWPDLNNQLPSYLAANGDRFQLAIQGLDTPEPSQVALTRRPGDVTVPPVEPPVVTPPPVTTPPSSVHVIRAKVGDEIRIKVVA